MKKTIATLAMILLTPATIAAAVPTFYADDTDVKTATVEDPVDNIMWDDMVSSLYGASATAETIELLSELEAVGVPEGQAAAFNRIARILRDKYNAKKLGISY